MQHFEQLDYSRYYHVYNHAVGVITSYSIHYTKLYDGLRPSFYFVSVNPDRFILGDQLDPYGGVVLPRSPLLSSGIPDKINLFDLNWGFYWRNYFDNARNSFFSNAVLDLGFAVDHLPQHDQSFLKGSNSADRSVPLPTKYVGMIDYGMPVWVPDPDYPLFMTTYALWEQQGEFKNLQLGTNSYNFV